MRQRLKKLLEMLIAVVLSGFAIAIIAGIYLLPIVIWFVAKDDIQRYIAVAMGLFIYGLTVFYVTKEEQISVKDGCVEYSALTDSYFQRYITHTGKKITKKFRITDIIDMTMYHHYTRSKSSETLYYTVTVRTREDSIQFTGRESDGYDEIWKVFQEVYPHLSVEFKRGLISFILNASIEKKKGYFFPISIYDDCFKLRIIRNAYVEGSKDRLLTCSWKDLKAEMDKDNMTCLFFIDEYEHPIYRFGIKNRRLVWTRFDHYVLKEIIDDLHKENVDRLSELSYMQE